MPQRTTGADTDTRQYREGKGLEMNVCDECLTAAYDDGAAPDIQAIICRDFGADISDHCCDETETAGEITCACQCH